MTELTTIAQGVLAWVQDGGHGNSNAGVIVDADGITMVDTLMVRRQWLPLAQAVEGLAMAIPRCILTSSHYAQVGGTPGFWRAAMHGRALTSAHLDQPADPHALRRLHPAFADDIPDELATRPITHVVDEVANISTAAVAVPTAGHQLENLMVLIPGADVLFAGAMCSFGTTPLAFDGNPGIWAATLDDVAQLADIIVPGHGPIGGADDVRAQRDYLLACVDAAHNGAPIASGPWDTWTDRHFDEINIERAAMLAGGDQSPPPSILRLLGLLD